jgi:hypothetical protein
MWVRAQVFRSWRRRIGEDHRIHAGGSARSCGCTRRSPDRGRRDQEADTRARRDGACRADGRVAQRPQRPRTIQNQERARGRWYSDAEGGVMARRISNLRLREGGAVAFLSRRTSPVRLNKDVAEVVALDDSRAKGERIPKTGPCARARYAYHSVSTRLATSQCPCNFKVSRSSRSVKHSRKQTSVARPISGG